MRKKLSLLALLICIAGMQFLYSQVNADLYEMEERVITWSNHNLSNPFTDVELKLYITAPSGRKLGSSFTFYGFYDGDGNGGQNGNVWKYRVLFDEPGQWTVRAKFVNPGTNNQKSGAPSEQTFVYNVSSTPVSGEHGPIYVDDDNWRRFEHADGTPWVPFVFHASGMLDQASWKYRKYIDEHMNRGIDALTVRFHYDKFGSARYNYLKSNNSRATSWPGASGFNYSRFDVATWQYHEEVIEYAQSKGMKLAIWFGISGINRQYESYGPMDQPNDNTLGAQQKLLIRYFLARWAAYPNWWHWTVNSEWEESGKEGLNVAYAKELRNLNPWKTLITNHSLRDWTLDGSEDGWDMVQLQKRVANTNDGAYDCRSFVENNDKWNIPVFNIEGIWYLSNSTRTEIASWTHIMAGGFAHVCHTESGSYESSWSADWDNLNLRHKEDATEVGKISRFFNEASWIVQFNEAQPNHSIVSVSGGHRAMCVSKAGTAHFIWVDEGGSPTINLSGESGTFSVKRYDVNNLNNPVTLSNVSGGGTRTLQAGPNTGFGKAYFYVLINEGANPLIISTSSPLPEAEEGEPYSQSLQASNVQGAASWSIISGSLPAGLSLSGNTISGTPSVDGTSTFTVRVTDDVAQAEKQFSITVLDVDDIPPVVTNVRAINQDASGVTIAWDTDEPATTRVQWGDAVGNYTGESGENTDLVTSHEMRIEDDFVTGQTYYLLIITTDANNNTQMHQDEFVYTFEHLACDASSDITTGDAPLTVNFTGVATGGTSGNGEYKESGGTVVIEAENFTGSATNGDATAWEVATSLSGYAGVGYITTPDNGIANGAWGSACEVSYNIDFSTSGTYNIWMYRYGADGAGNSVWVGVDGIQLGSNDNGSTGSWGWYKYGSTSISAGMHSFNIQRREDGYNVDKIILTTGSGTPSGNNQAESQTAAAFNYSWVFGDGSSATEQNPSHTYTGAGTYTAILTVSDGTETATDQVVVTAGNVDTYTLSVGGGTGDGEYAAGTQVEIVAGAAPAGMEFDRWVGNVSVIADVNDPTTTVTMPASDVGVDATYRTIPVYSLTVNNGTGDGNYTEGTEVTITADVAPAGQVFDQWTGNVDAVADITASTTTVTMPTQSVTVSATYKDLPSELITNVAANSSNTYERAENLSVGDVYYTDRTFVIESLPDDLQDAEYIRTPNNDKALTTADVLNFDLTNDATVYVAYDSRATDLPSWMEGYELAGWIITTSDVALNVYAKSYTAGHVTLGGNRAGGGSGAGSNYFVIAVPGEPMPNYTVTFTVMDGMDPVVGASVELNGVTVVTDASGRAVFANVPQYTDIEYTVTANGFRSHTVDISVVDNMSKMVVLEYQATDVEEKTADIRVYPNPAFDDVIVSGITDFNMIQVVDISGKVMAEMQHDGSGIARVDLSGLSTGVYFISLSNKEKTKTLKLMVQ